MPITAEDKGRGYIRVDPRDETFQVRVYGAIGSQAIVNSLRIAREHQELRDIDMSSVDEIIKRLKANWKKLDRYLTGGGMVSQQGKGLMFRDFKDKQQPKQLRQGFAYMSASDYFGEIGAENTDPFRAHEFLYLVAPSFGARLKVFTYRKEEVPRPNAKIFVTFNSEPKGFSNGIIEGFSEMMRASFCKEPEVVQLQTRPAVVQRMYDHSRKQVPVLEQM